MSLLVPKCTFGTAPAVTRNCDTVGKAVAQLVINGRLPTHTLAEGIELREVLSPVIVVAPELPNARVFRFSGLGYVYRATLQHLVDDGRNETDAVEQATTIYQDCSWGLLGIGASLDSLDIDSHSYLSMAHNLVGQTRLDDVRFSMNGVLGRQEVGYVDVIWYLLKQILDSWQYPCDRGDRDALLATIHRIDSAGREEMCDALARALHFWWGQQFAIFQNLSRAREAIEHLPHEWIAECRLARLIDTTTLTRRMEAVRLLPSI